MSNSLHYSTQNCKGIENDSSKRKGIENSRTRPQGGHRAKTPGTMTVKGHLLSFLNGKLGRWDLSLYEQFVCQQGENISIINQGECR